MDLTMNLAEETKRLIQGSHDIRLQIHEQGKRLAHLQKGEAIAVARFNSIIAVDKALTNADKRKAALTELKASDEEYLAIEAEMDTIRNEIELLQIQLQFNSDMIKLNRALINAQQ
ncbi:hypothetical protein N836_31620 [Leptolyngbya sp. Heron Island J]|nr:hypothetical protein N836_31620 [Leptolyngbya sp. Heron Island J]